MLSKIRHNIKSNGRPGLDRPGSAASFTSGMPQGLLRRQSSVSPSEHGSQNAGGALDHMYDFSVPSPDGLRSPSLGSAPRASSLVGGATELSAASSWIAETDAYRVMARHLYEQASAKGFFSSDPSVPRGVALRMAKGVYVVHPPEDEDLDVSTRSVSAINCEVCVRVSSPVVAAISSRLAWGTPDVPITPSEHVQVVETMEEAAMARKAQYAAFVRREYALLVWADSVDKVLERIQSFENKMVDFVWKSAMAHKVGGAQATHATPMLAFLVAGVIVNIVFMIIAPINQMDSNSRYFSGVAPKRMNTRLPHITCQIPVYKEDLEEVIRPTIESLQKAISTYTLQGGKAAIVVSDDGMQLISEEDRAIRQEFYDVQNISWVARPGHNVDGFTRNGRFKKASNLNITLQLSMATDRLADERRPKEDEELIRWTDQDEDKLYAECLAHAIPSIHPGIQAVGNIRMGELILLLDSDTRVPADCLIDAASEMAQSPDVGIIQHCSGVMIVTDNMFEKGIAFFTRMINFAITYCVANGDVAPFVGHNAFLRWSAMQEAAFVDPLDGKRKIWSESHVSEDFDMALRLLMHGYCVRWATYSNNEFQEGVSLTAEDELNRWQKYAFGVSELMFHPFRQWLFKGPCTPLFRKFIGSRALPLHYKVGACAYMFSYYAIASALPLTFALYLVQGWFYPVLDLAFLPPFQVWIAVAVVFGAAGQVSTIVARFRSKTDSIFSAALEHLIWTPFLVIFFAGSSFHVLVALVAHPLGINMTWGATLESLGKSNLFKEMPLLFKRFWPTLTMCTVWLAGIAVLSLPVVPLEWQISDFFTMWPSIWIASMHILYPFVLNPALLRFSF